VLHEYAFTTYFLHKHVLTHLSFPVVAPPVLQYHYNILSALALQEDTPSPDDTTLPDVQLIVSRAGSFLKSINKTLDTDPRYSHVPWRRSTTAAVIPNDPSVSANGRASRGATAGAGDSDEERREKKKVKVSKEKPSIALSDLEETLVAAFRGGETKLKKVSFDVCGFCGCWRSFLRLLLIPSPFRHSGLRLLPPALTSTSTPTPTPTHSFPYSYTIFANTVRLQTIH
jgi:hypothetical protein